MSVFNLLNVGRSAMNATAFGTQTHGQNAANAATEGYTRRVARLQPVAPPPAGGGGAQASGSLRKIDPYVERRLLGARTEQGGAEARLEVLGGLDTTFADEPGNVAEALAAFEGSLRELAAYPGDTGAREAVLGRAEALERAFRSADAQLTQLRGDANDRVQDEVRTLNERLDRVAELGNAIARSELSGREASDLRDQRDEALRQLADQVPITVLPRDDGQVTVLLAGNLQLVDEDGNVSPLGTQRDPATGDVRVTRVVAGAVQDITGELAPDGEGRLGGTLAGRDGALTAAQEALDQLAFDLSAAYNAVHTTGVDALGGTGRNLFEPPAAVAGAAAAFRVSVDVRDQPERLAAAEDALALPNDDRNALALAELAQGNTALGGTATATEGYTALLAQVGADVRFARGDLDRADGLLSQTQALRESVSGVNTDEEMVGLMEFQRAYQASLRVVQTADEMLAELVQLKR
ncbi:MAG: flagellar hook-associated protein FlgK [Myxococcota bacterium]